MFSDDRGVDVTCHAGIELDANDALQQLISSLGGHIGGALTSMTKDLAIGVFTYNDNIFLGSLLVIIRYYTIKAPVRTILEKTQG